MSMHPYSSTVVLLGWAVVWSSGFSMVDLCDETALPSMKLVAFKQEGESLGFRTYVEPVYCTIEF